MIKRIYIRYKLWCSLDGYNTQHTEGLIMMYNIIPTFRPTPTGIPNDRYFRIP